jgi:hypothetical protein
MPHRPSHHHGRGHGARREACLRLRPPVPDAGRRARSLALAAHPEENLGCVCALTSVSIQAGDQQAERPAWLAVVLP